MNLMDEIWDKLEAFARKELGKPLFGRIVLTPASRLEEDLGLTGVDAIEFIDKWAEAFGVNAQGFPYDRYFGSDNLDVVGSVLGIFSKRFRQPKLVPLTLGMLADAMRRGRWETALIEAPSPPR
jgi:acyl carrier protein